MSSTTLLYIIFKSYCGLFEKNPLKLVPILSHTFHYGNWCGSHFFTLYVQTNPKIFWSSFVLLDELYLSSLGATFYLIWFTVKKFWKYTLPYILLWKLMLKSLFHTFGPYQAKNILMMFCRSRWALQSNCIFNLNSMVVSFLKIKLKQFCHIFPIHFLYIFYSKICYF